MNLYPQINVLNLHTKTRNKNTTTTFDTKPNF